MLFSQQLLYIMPKVNKDFVWRKHDVLFWQTFLFHLQVFTVLHIELQTNYCKNTMAAGCTFLFNIINKLTKMTMSGKTETSNYKKDWGNGFGKWLKRDHNLMDAMDVKTFWSPTFNFSTWTVYFTTLSFQRPHGISQKRWLISAGRGFRPS